MKCKIRVETMAIRFASKVIEPADKHRRSKLITEIQRIFTYPEIDDIIDWDNGKSCPGMGDWLRELFSNEYYFDDEDEDADKDGYVDLTNGIFNELCCAIRIAIDLIIEPSMGVAGFFITDLKKAFDGVIPDWICKLFGTNLNDAKDDAMIWL